MAAMIESKWQNLPWLTIALVGSVAALYAALGPAPEAWVYDRAAVAGGEWWRLLSAHWLHGDDGHLGWNLAALALLGAIVERHSRGLLLAGLLSGSLGVDAMLWFDSHGLTHYCGLSGVLNALLPLALAKFWRPDRRGAVLLVGGLSLGKILFEMASGNALFTATSWVSVPKAHLAGWLAGLLLVVWRTAARLQYPLPAGSTDASFSVVMATEKKTT
jgi:rhomboid family GlyGly-CTERM serine protease